MVSLLSFTKSSDSCLDHPYIAVFNGTWEKDEIAISMKEKCEQHFKSQDGDFTNWSFFASQTQVKQLLFL